MISLEPITYKYLLIYVYDFMQNKCERVQTIETLLY